MKRITVYVILFLLARIVSPAALPAEDDFELEIEDEENDIWLEIEDEEDDIEIEIEDEETLPDTDIGGNKKTVKNIIERFINSGKGKTKARYSWFFAPLEVEPEADPEPDRQSHILEQYSTYSSFLQENFFRFDLSTYVAFGNQKYTYASKYTDMDLRDWEDWFQYSNNRRSYFDINECYISFFLPVCDIIIGKKIFINTLSSLYTPADNYKAIDIHDPFDPRELGRMQAEIQFFTGNVIFTFLMWPFYQGGLEFSPLSRWGYYRVMYEIEQGTIHEAILTIDERIYPPIAFENISYLGKVKGTVWGWDFFLSAFHGFAGNTVFRIMQMDSETIKISEVVPVFNAAFGFSTTFKNMEFHGEALYNYTYSLRDDHYIRYTGGFRYTFDELGGMMDKIEVIVEYAREDIFEKQNNPDYTDSTEERRLFKNDILALILLQFSPQWNLNLYGQYTIADSGFIFSCHLDYRIVDNLALSLGTQLFLAPEMSDLYWWRDNNRLIVQAVCDY